MQSVKDRVKEHEGFRDTVYSDSLGFATIGYGHLVILHLNLKNLPLIVLCCAIF